MDTDTPTKIHRRRMAIGSAVAFALAIPVGALAWTTAVQAADEVTLPEEHEEVVTCFVEATGEELSEEELAELQAEENALAAHLDSLGIAYEMVDFGFGSLRYVEWDYEDEAANEAVEDFWAERFPLAPEEVAAMNAEADALAAHFDAAGVRYTIDTDPDGVRWVEWDEGDPAAEAAVDVFYALTPEEVAEINADADGLAAHLTAAGIEHTVVTDPDGSRYVEWDYEDEAANAAVDEYYDIAPGDEATVEAETICEG